MRRRTTWRSIPLIAVLLNSLAGCGGESAEVPGGGKSFAGAELIIETGGYQPPAPGACRKWGPGGLASLGDINGDGYTDLLVASGSYPGSFAAFSTKDAQRLWQVKAVVGSKAKATGEKGFVLGPVRPIGDLNGDGVPDVWAPNTWTHREFLIFSGKDGKRLERRESHGHIWPMRCEDATGDSVPDIIFSHGLKLGICVMSGKDFSETTRQEDLWPMDDRHQRRHWALPRFADDDGDGVEDYLAATVYAVSAEGQEQTLGIFSGKDFSIIRHLIVQGVPLRSDTTFAGPGDLDGDGVPDVVTVCRYGAGPAGESSCLAAISGKSGALLWKVLGTSLPGGPKRIAVDAKTGKQRELPVDVGFDGRVAVLPDLNNDGASELAIALPVMVGGKRVRGVSIFSGATGKRVAVLRLRDGQGTLQGGQMAVVDNADGQGRPGLAVTGQISRHKYMIAIFLLPQLDK